MDTISLSSITSSLQTAWTSFDLHYTAVDHQPAPHRVEKASAKDALHTNHERLQHRCKLEQAQLQEIGAPDGT